MLKNYGSTFSSKIFGIFVSNYSVKSSTNMNRKKQEINLSETIIFNKDRKKEEVNRKKQINLITIYSLLIYRYTVI